MTTTQTHTGRNYRASRDVAEVARMIRLFVKERFPDFRFSVRIRRYSGGCSVSVYLERGKRTAFKPFEEWTPEDLERWREARNTVYRLASLSTLEDSRRCFVHSDEVQAMKRELEKYLESLRWWTKGDWDDYSTNFYYEIGVSHWYVVK